MSNGVSEDKEPNKLSETDLGHWQIDKGIQ